MNLAGFVEEKLLGKGTYGQVYKAKRLTDGISYAVKVVNLNALNHREIEDSVNEIRLMASFTSPFIIRFYEAFCDKKRLCIVTEYSRLGDLAHVIHRRKQQRRPFQEEDIWRFFIQMLEGLKVLHSRGVLHRDLKSANILLSAPDFIKIADLGVSTVLHATVLA
jgi:NIMA (never in mitosis gene a)-related kinase